MQIAGLEPLLPEVPYVEALLGGFLIAVGAYFLNMAIMHGQVGPPSAIANITGAMIVLLDFLIMGILPNTIKMIGMAMAIVGAIIILLSDMILVKCGITKFIPEEIVAQFVKHPEELTEPLVGKKTEGELV
jgi:drug/metabolite transporter (DMT)-like permease